ncbi:hypothetical protein [Trueperella pyogenes]
MIQPHIAQQILAFAIGQDPRIKPASENEATTMLAAWAESLPDWATFDMAKEALIRRARDPRASQFPVTMPELIQHMTVVRKRHEQQARNAAGVYTTLERRKAIESDHPVPMPPGWKQELFNKINNPKGNQQ